MFKFSKAATLAAVSATLAIAAFSADAGFAFGSEEGSLANSAELIEIDPAILAADEQTAEAVRTDILIPKLDVDGDIIFAPGTGDSISGSNDPQILNQVDVRSLAELVRVQDISGPLDDDTKCLASAVYFESKGESLAGQLAVAKVILNRAESGRFPDSLCGVVLQKSQFSFVRGRGIPDIDENRKSWKTAVAISRIAQDDMWESQMEDALFFHARHVSPRWRLTRLGAIDNHIFYR